MVTHKKSLALIIIASLLIVLMAALPWKELIANRLSSELAAQGFKDVRLRVASISPSSISLDEISLGDMPLALKNLTIDYSLPQLWRGRLEDTTLIGTSPALRLATPSFEAASGEVAIKLKRGNTNKEWSGIWQLQNIDLKNMELPPLAADGTIDAKPEKITVRGNISSTDGTTRAEFVFEHLPATPEKSLLTVTSARMPLSGGNISVHHLRVPINSTEPIHVRLEVQSIAIGSVLASLTGQRATATGLVSGLLPVSIARDGTYTFQRGTLQAEAPGTITLAPDAIPGDNQQVAILRDVLKNFHYSNLLIGINSDKDNKLSAQLVLEGSNPEAYDGRPVKLNVNLTGDVLDFVQHNMMAISNPEKLLRQDSHAKP